MKVLVSGVCGFVGSTLAEALAARGHDIVGFDSLIRRGSEINRNRLRAVGIDVRHADLRSQSDVDALPRCDWVLDAAANPSVLAGIDGATSSRQLVEHNLLGTVNLLEYCKQHSAGFTLLSTSRVYSIEPLANLEVIVTGDAFQPASKNLPEGISAQGINELFSTAAPVSLYGATKIASEVLALEYGAAFRFPVWINRCGVLAGAGQFGRPDQGIFSYWLHSWAHRRPLRYIGFDGLGHQVRDCLHPRDLIPALEAQFIEPLDSRKPRIANFSGGVLSATSLRELSAWCENRFGSHAVVSSPDHRPYDIPWIVLDASLAQTTWQWKPTTTLDKILEEIAAQAEKDPTWLDLSA